MIKDRNYLLNISEKILNKAKKLGATDASVVVTNSISEDINYRNKKIDGSTRSENLGANLTTYFGKKKSSLTTSNLREDVLDGLVEKCFEATKITPEDELNSLPEKELHFKGIKELDLFDKTQLDNKDKVNYLKEAEEIAFSDPKIVNTNGSGFSQNKSNFVLANSNGFSDGYESSQFTAYCEVVSKENGSMERDYEYSSKRFFSDLLSPKIIGENASRFAIRKLNPKKIKSEKMTVVFDKRISKNILSVFSNAISSSVIAKGTTFLKGKENSQIFNKNVNIVDKSDIKRANGSKYFDKEGVRVDELDLVKDGVLKNLLVDTYNGKKINKRSNGRCGGTSNLFFKKGNKSFNELINSKQRILYINETIGHGTNLITGDYSVGASGQIIENGEFKYPVSEITIAGNFNEIFKNLILADDLELNYSTNSPTMLVEGITVGGI